jgi:hypothetical protein
VAYAALCFSAIEILAGPALLGIVAVGFVAFGLYSVADARYRRVG